MCMIFFEFCYKMWVIPTGTSWVKKKKNQVKSPSIWSRVPKTGSDPLIESGRDSGRDTNNTSYIMHLKPNIGSHTKRREAG